MVPFDGTSATSFNELLVVISIVFYLFLLFIVIVVINSVIVIAIATIVVRVSSSSSIIHTRGGYCNIAIVLSIRDFATFDRIITNGTIRWNFGCILQ